MGHVSKQILFNPDLLVCDNMLILVQHKTPGITWFIVSFVLDRDGHETSMAETETLATQDRDVGLTSRDETETFKFRDETETRRLQVSRHDRDVEMHVVFNAVQVNVDLTTVATVTA